jgi:type I restriction-modification system DNA methylase subunit
MSSTSIKSRSSKKTKSAIELTVVDNIVLDANTFINKAENVEKPNEHIKAENVKRVKKQVKTGINEDIEINNKTVSTEIPEKPFEVKKQRGAKKIKKVEDTSYIKFPEKDAIVDFSDTIKIDKTIDKSIEVLQSKIKAMHQVLWEIEHMDGEQALDEIMKLIFLKYLENFVSDKEEPNKIDLFNPKYHKNILEEGDEDDIENFNIAKKYLQSFKTMLEDLDKAHKNGNEKDALNTLWNSNPNKCDIFKTITKILANHPTTNGLYTQTNMLDIKEAKTLKELLKHINSSCFDNSREIEDLIGEIYEYFLNKYNKKKSALGQFFTPRMLMNIAIKYKLTRITEILKMFKEPVIADKCMGTGGWLVKLFNAFKDVNKNILLHGREFKPNTYQYGIINLISTTGKYPYKPALGCSLTNIEDILIHLIVSNPPFKGKFDYNKLRETYNKNKRLGFNSAKFEDIFFLKDEDNTPLQFLQLYIHLLEKGGLCMIVLPYGELFFKDGAATNDIRKKLLDKINITDIILCPTGIFTHTDVKVCMLVFEKNSGGTKEIKFSKFKFDKTKQILQSVKHITTVKKADILKEPICSFYHMDYLHDDHVQIIKVKMPKYEWVAFGDIFDLVKGELQSSKVVECEDPELFDGINYIKFVTGAKDDSWKIIKKLDESYCCGENIFISENGNGNCRPVKYYNGNCNYSNLLSLLVCKGKYQPLINKKYIYYYLKNIQSYIEEKYQKGACNQTLDLKNLNRMEIPIPPIDIQNNLVKENNKYDQKIEDLKQQLLIVEEKMFKNTLEFLEQNN